MRKAVKNFLITTAYNCVVLVVLLELTSFLIAITGFRGINHYTSYYLALVNLFRQQSLVRRGQWYTEFEDWGTWHLPNAVTRHSELCFAVNYRSNRYGARDRDRPLNSDGSRIVVLGDSFIEGWGVSEDQRLTNRLEEKLGQSVLNFGVAFHSGPLQYQILYEQLASDFDHDHVIIGILPANDFVDNDETHWQRDRNNYYRNRYRPYYNIQGDTITPVYTVPQPTDARNVEAREVDDWHEQLLYRATWSYVVLDKIGSNIIDAENSVPIDDYSGYEDATNRQIQPVLLSVQQIQRVAQSRGAEISVVLIPAMEDFIRKESQNRLKVQRVFQQFANQNDIQVIDLLEEMPKIEPNYTRYFHTCDGHWSVEGNDIAARAIFQQLEL